MPSSSSLTSSSSSSPLFFFFFLLFFPPRLRPYLSTSPVSPPMRNRGSVRAAAKRSSSSTLEAPLFPTRRPEAAPSDLVAVWNCGRFDAAAKRSSTMGASSSPPPLRSERFFLPDLGIAVVVMAMDGRGDEERFCAGFVVGAQKGLSAVRRSFDKIFVDIDNHDDHHPRYHALLSPPGPVPLPYQRTIFTRGTWHRLAMLASLR